MELMKNELATFTFQDIKIHVRTRASIADKLAMELVEAEGAEQLRAGAAMGDALGSMGKKVVGIFIDGWEGVTVDGKPAPYSFDALMHGFPAANAADLLPALCAFVNEHVDILTARD